MCTVSIIPLQNSGAAGYRVVCNRDESWTRPPAIPPRWCELAVGGRSVRGLWPVDAAAGGTWIGTSESGLAVAVLNLNPDPPFDAAGIPGLRSRGHLAPELIDCEGVLGAVERLRSLDLDRFAPVRIVLAAMGDQGLQVAEARWDRLHLDVAWHGPRPVCFASSGLGDRRAEPRLGLFEELVVARGGLPEHQDEFHRHWWHDRREISILMCREEARTVSRTILEFVRGGAPEMRYEAVPPPAAATVERAEGPVGESPEITIPRHSSAVLPRG